MTKVYKVLQTQTSEDISDLTIYIFSNKEAANECARRLNLEYAENVLLNNKGLFEEVSQENEDDDVHYYKVESEEVLDEPNNWDPNRYKDNEQSDCYVLALYDSDGEFIGFDAEEPTKDKDKATLYNYDSAFVRSAILDNSNLTAEMFHYTKAEDVE